jgi:hypothetical protein
VEDIFKSNNFDKKVEQDPVKIEEEDTIMAEQTTKAVPVPTITNVRVYF